MPPTPPRKTPPKQKKSGCVTLTIVGLTIGVAALCIHQCTKEDDVDDDDVTVVQHGRSYSNNHYIPGVGYYHAPFRAWFPHSYNSHEPGRGYFAGGNWSAAQHTSGIIDSTPNSAAVSEANRTWRSANPAEFASRKSALQSTRSSSRGGFGSSGRSSSS